ncbi:right-handed parallel beta-helix repeat-containing protein [Amycolatopsis regifaucium]|uniref:right-handed parallel beta-helix repeat-containing protein n=1 Tax=Amycolatopsis regifaucium TaxID=546365 RepID=UPI0008F65D6E|nr:right-handed parallel beta-helix repeat-containing protein [Amycolatopsis regifaucium]SFH41419.1 Right handed beta helix region [Amycolatopsis regifaucium]
MHGKRPAVAKVLAIAASLLLGASVAATPAAADPPKVPRTFFVDCARGLDVGPGTSPDQAWKLSKANTMKYLAGDTILFKAGVTCTGTFAPTGSGTAGRPIKVGRFGSGTKPRIDGKGAASAIHLRNVAGWELRDLDITNTGPAPAANQQRAGIYVLLEDYGVGSHYLVSNVDVHDVNGCDCRFPPSGGVVFYAAGSKTPTRFDDVTVTKSTITHVDRIGVGMLSTWLGSPLVPMTKVRFTENTVRDIGGEGMVVFNGSGAIIERNIIDGFNERSTQDSAGAYGWNAEGTRIRYNDVSNGKGQAMAFSLDDANIDTIIEYNFSHDNKGGFLLQCSGNELKNANGIARYNLSQNDAAGTDEPYTSTVTIACGDASNTQVYNNVFYAQNSPRLVTNVSTSATGVHFTNNIFYGQPSGSSINDTTGQYVNNVFYQVSGVPADSITSIIGDPRLVSPGTATSMSTTNGYRLREASPAIQHGAPVANNGGKDFFGNPLTDKLNIGAYEGAGVTP